MRGEAEALVVDVQFFAGDKKTANVSMGSWNDADNAEIADRDERSEGDRGDKEFAEGRWEHQPSDHDTFRNSNRDIYGDGRDGALSAFTNPIHSVTLQLYVRLQEWGNEEAVMLTLLIGGQGTPSKLVRENGKRMDKEAT